MRQTALLAALVLCGSSAFAADPGLMNLVMPDARILAGVNAANAKSSPFGQFVLAKIAQLGGEPQQAIAATGFDPLQDVSEVLAATAAVSSRPEGLLLLRGNFNVDKIVAAAMGMAHATLQTYGGNPLLSFANPRNKSVMALSFIGSSIAVAGDLASVEAAIDRSAGVNSIDPALALQVSELSANQDEWLASSASVASLLPASVAMPATGPVAQLLPVLKSVQSFGGGIKFGADVQFTGEATANDAQNATALSAVVKLGVALASMAGGKGGANGAQIAQLIGLLQTLQVTASGPEVNLALSVPETQVESLLNQAVLNRATQLAVPVLPAHRLTNGN